MFSHRTSRHSVTSELTHPRTRGYRVFNLRNAARALALGAVLLVPSAGGLDVAAASAATTGNVAPVLSLSTGKVSWSAQAGATGFRGAVSTAPAGSANRTTTYQELGKVTSWTPTAPQTGQTLYYGVASEGPSGDQWSVKEVSAIGAVNVSPVLTLSGAKVSWSAQSGATGFRASVSTAPVGAANRTTTYQELGNVTSWTPTAPQPGQTLYYGVASGGPGGDQWSAKEVSITTPKPASNVSPVLTLSGGKVSWSAQSGATGFRAAVSTAPVGAANRTTTYQELGNVTSWTPTAPQPGQTSVLRRGLGRPRRRSVVRQGGVDHHAKARQ